MTIIAIHQLPKRTVSEFFQEHWGTTEMVISVAFMIVVN